VRPISAVSQADAQGLLGLLFDLDDTVLDAGRLSVGALDALYRLQASGLILVGVTGRPASWGQVLIRQWPISGMLTENGSIAVVRHANRIQLLDRASPEERKERAARLALLVAGLRQRFPELEPSDDVTGRVADYSFDIAESKLVPAEIVSAAREFARDNGARVIQSSIQLHVSYEVDDKASGVVRFLRSAHGIDPSVATIRFGFVGDSENDASCFAAFRHSFGVANLRGRPSLPPRYLASEPAGAGFQEIADMLVEHRFGGEVFRPAGTALH
jgi:HAD superfamily hydrolase (TIGR01484 family)